MTLSSISPNLSKHWSFLAFWLSLCFGSFLLFLVCHDAAFLFSTRVMTALGWLPNAHRPRCDNLVWENRRDSRHVTSPASWVYVMPRIKNSKRKWPWCWMLFGRESKFTEKRLSSISWIALQRHKKLENLLKIVSCTSIHVPSELWISSLGIN